MIIACGHRRERGKDTVCDYLVKKYRFKKDCFAYSLKEGIGRKVFGFNYEQLCGNLKNTIDPFWERTPREILQKVGTDLFRNCFDEDIWVKTLQKRLEIINYNKNDICISDLRMLNEAKALKKLGAILIKINRVIDFNEKIDMHQSEIDLLYFNDWDYVIYNNTTFDNLYKQIDIIMKDIKEKEKTK